MALCAPTSSAARISDTPVEGEGVSFLLPALAAPLLQAGAQHSQPPTPDLKDAVGDALSLRRDARWVWSKLTALIHSSAPVNTAHDVAPVPPHADALQSDVASTPELMFALRNADCEAAPKLIVDDAPPEIRASGFAQR